eukprot:UN27256
MKKSVKRNLVHPIIPQKKKRKVHHEQNNDHIDGSECSSVSSDDQNITIQTTVPERVKYAVQIVYEHGMYIREKVDFPGTCTGQVLKSGTVVKCVGDVILKRTLNGLIQFYKLADGSGWIFNHNGVAEGARILGIINNSEKVPDGSLGNSMAKSTILSSIISGKEILNVEKRIQEEENRVMNVMKENQV